MKKLLTLFCSLSFLSCLALGEQLKDLPSQSCIIPNVTYAYSASSKDPTNCLPPGTTDPTKLNGQNLGSYLDTKCPTLIGQEQETHKNAGANKVVYSYICTIICTQPKFTCYYSGNSAN